MGQKRWAISLPFEGFSLAEHVELAQEAERLGYSDGWTSEVDGIDGFSPLAVVAGTTQMRVGIAIANVYTRGPATLAMTAAGIAEIAPGRFCLGIGAGSQAIVEVWNGGKFEHVTKRVREMVQFLRPALAGERVVFHGETFNVEGFRLSRTPTQPIPIHVAALRPPMLRLAGALADGCIINWLSADDVKKSVAVVREAATQAGRDPDAIEITARVFICVDPPSPEAELGVRRHINFYLNVPVYRAFQKWLGREEVLTPMWKAWDSGDRKGAVAAVPQQVMNDLVLWGSPDGVRAHVRRYMEAGVDTVFLQFHSFVGDAAQKREVIHKALRDLGPGQE
jgi:probable F420-dependent oxidoreductase